MCDVSVERQVEITGPDAAKFTQYLSCRDLSKMQVGQCKYLLLTDQDGGIVNINSALIPTKRDPFIISGSINGKLVVILPLMIETNLFGKCLKWLGAETSDYNGMILDSNFAAKRPHDLFNQIMDLATENIVGLYVIYLSRNPSTDEPTQKVISDSLTGWIAEHASHTLKLSNPWKTHYAQIRSGKSRQRLRQKLNALKKTGDISFKQIRNPQNRMEVTRRIMDWKTHHLMKQGNRNPFGSEAFPSQTRLAINSSIMDFTAGSLKVFGLYRDNLLIAGMLAFVDGGKFYYCIWFQLIHLKFPVNIQLVLNCWSKLSNSPPARA